SIINDAFQNIVQRNVISGNGSDGVFLAGTFTTGNRVRGNYIGVDISSNALGNGGNGVEIVNQASYNFIGDPAFSQVISGNGRDGVRISDSGTNGNLVQSNYIGTDAAGASAVPNRSNGVDILNGAAEIGRAACRERR